MSSRYNFDIEQNSSPNQHAFSTYKGYLPDLMHLENKINPFNNVSSPKNR